MFFKNSNIHLVILVILSTLEYCFSHKLDWGSYIFHIAKTTSKKTGALVHFTKFLSFEIVICLTTLCDLLHFWAGAIKC